jgi:hypothetical protein
LLEAVPPFLPNGLDEHIALIGREGHRLAAQPDLGPR